ncbi:hypothetical protein LK994_11050 [Ferruginibacter lapsinanis]|uniref:hypothetical protein n=1 Tax=Ferruginibacter lapsinanis TaxID=563172 RepID=UPI001E6512F6|nr:hypothetical protein [Ferruginibacter lapsinanis]UEG49169.1 hypothetical protein LK994_11050 [Ferruginibacter lapsinanis]
MKQTIIFLFSVISLTPFYSCVSTQAFSKTSYISNDAVYLPKEKTNEVLIIAICNTADKKMYENITDALQSSFSAKNIKNDKLFYAAESDAPGIAGTLSYSLIINPVKDEYIKDELNNPMIIKQITVILQKNNGEKIAAFAIAIDRTKSDTRSGNEIAGLILSYLKKKNFI